MKLPVYLYILIPLFFLFLSLGQPSSFETNIWMVILGSLSLGLFVGFVIHIATLFSKKIKKGNGPTK
ncbi:hypothetical protein AJ85_07135 [Alkalihalobacillus alcalophilus ATCC 27647 = CGMCC 1.3604]|uniref:Uncharacterized protein n=1 Tax=Alkalihalobacillus alcalophilus ATCC 27647 = CGMCC 1.3604 TaxID=1218173 RepID=A0A094WJV3_ALKAL|nr:hypothetical protein [Alkalihalobacillus alcalophilus]KGA98054.1 hypothetical protein BALCAV_0206525 [Alkalihalobacillus alcalophilus ATCC 27647 = CGMCC 1.3604]MED1561064.1 hypothetical protein [Alkalihalobacillus alcalophilus]THG88314.1 hypothetical protein AJ85_07135 [Alkalihalobacillus alcalophilus ATCC 27647 = CGMCC 1.3604]